MIFFNKGQFLKNILLSMWTLHVIAAVVVVLSVVIALKVSKSKNEGNSSILGGSLVLQDFSSYIKK